MDRPLVTALVGVTIACPEPRRLAEFLIADGGWEVLTEGPIEPALETLWGIAPDSAGARAAIVRSPGADRGMVRIVTGPERLPPAGRMGTRWSGIEIVVMKDIEGLHASLAADPAHRVIHGLKDADFTDVGANIHRFFICRPPGGTHIIYTQAVTKARDYEFPAAGSRIGHIFDVHLVSREFARSRKFYRETLGMIAVLEDKFDRGMWHDTWKLPDGRHVDLDIIKGDAEGFGLGGIEMQGYDNDLIDPLPAVADRFDGGSCMATFSTRDIDAAYRAVAASGAATILSKPMPIRAAPYRGAKAFCFAGPGGERVEIVERAWS